MVTSEIPYNDARGMFTVHVSVLLLGNCGTVLFTCTVLLRVHRLCLTEWCLGYCSGTLVPAFSYCVCHISFLFLLLNGYYRTCSFVNTEYVK